MLFQILCHLVYMVFFMLIDQSASIGICLMEMLTEDAVARVVLPYKLGDMINGEIYGPLVLLKVSSIMQLTSINFTATTEALHS